MTAITTAEAAVDPDLFDLDLLDRAAQAGACTIASHLDDVLPAIRRTEVRCLRCSRRDWRDTFRVGAHALADWITHFAETHHCPHRPASRKPTPLQQHQAADVDDLDPAEKTRRWSTAIAAAEADRLPRKIWSNAAYRLYQLPDDPQGSPRFALQQTNTEPASAYSAVDFDHRTIAVVHARILETQHPHAPADLAEIDAALANLEDQITPDDHSDLAIAIARLRSAFDQIAAAYPDAAPLDLDHREDDPDDPRCYQCGEIHEPA